MDRLLFRVSVLLIQVTLFVSCAEDFVAVEKAQMSRLYVISTVPSDGSTGVKRDLGPVGAVVINFSKAIDEKYADPNFINFTCNETAVNYKVSLSEDRQVLSLKLRSGTILPERAECRVVISRLIRDTVGLPFYLNPSELEASTYPLDGDGGVDDDIVIKDSESGTKSGNKDKRSGEGDYVFSFQTEYLPLEITGISPADKEVVAVDAIPLFQGVVIGFNKSLDPDSVNISNFLLIGEAIEPVLSEDAKTVTLRPASGLKEGKDYTVMIMPFVTDTSGISLEETLVYGFRTDFVVPEVTSISIVDGSTEVDYKTDSIKIDFNKDMDPSTINNSTIRLIGVDRYSVRYERRSAFVEDFVLFERWEYSVEISSAIMDISGFYLKSAYSSHFRTSYDAPFVKRIFPQDKASGIPVDLKSIDIEFSEDMNFENIKREFFSISNQKNFEIKVKDNRSLSLLFFEDFLAGNTYTVEVSSLFMDISGINMEKDFISTFKISETPDNNPPSDILIYSKPIRDPPDESRQGFVIEWKAPGGNILNNIPSGKVRGYRLAYSDSPFETSDFDKMRHLLGVPTPLPPGKIQNITLYSLVDMDNNEVPIIYNRPYYFMLSATDGTNIIYSNLLRAGILAETGRVRWGSKFAGYSLKRIEDFNGEDLVLIGDTDEIKDNLVTGALFIEKMENGIMREVMRLYGKTDGSLFGYAIEVLDLNSDGCPDIAVSAPLDGENREGAVYLYFQTRDQNGCRFNNDEPVRFSAGARDSFFGLSMGRIRLNGEDNLLVGAPRDGALSYGAVYIYKNRLDKSQIPPAGDIKISGNQPGTSFGYAVLAADFNGDGCDDTIISAPDAMLKSAGEVYVFYSTTGVEGCRFPSFNVESPSFVMSGEGAFARFGSRLFVSDLDGDEKDEIFISARDETEKKGIVYIRRGEDGGFIKIYGKQDGDFGYSFAEADDYLKDGCKGKAGSCRDVFISDKLLGRVYLLEGRKGPLDYDLDTLPQFGAEYNATSFGYSLLIDKSGFFENLVVAAPYMSRFGNFVSNLFLYR